MHRTGDVATFSQFIFQQQSQDQPGVDSTGRLHSNPGVVLLCQHSRHSKRNTTSQYLLPGNGSPEDHSLCAVSVQPCQTEGSNLSPTPICCLEPHCFCVRCPSSANVNEPRRVIPQLIMLSAASAPGAALQSTALQAGGSFPGVQRLM